MEKTTLVVALITIGHLIPLLFTSFEYIRLNAIDFDLDLLNGNTIVPLYNKMIKRTN